MDWVTTSQIQIVSELRVNDAVTIFLMNDVLNVISYVKEVLRIFLKNLFFKKA